MNILIKELMEKGFEWYLQDINRREITLNISFYRKTITCTELFCDCGFEASSVQEFDKKSKENLFKTRKKQLKDEMEYIEEREKEMEQQ